MQAANSNAEFIATQLLPPKQDGTNEDARVALTAEIIKDLLPGVDWKKYEAFKDKIMIDAVNQQISNPPPEDNGEGGY